MTTGTPAPARAPTPRPKGAATSGVNSESVAAVNPRLTPSHPASGTATLPEPGPRRAPRSGVSDPLSDRATAFLIRRTLCPQQLDKGRNTPTPTIDLLPPLTSRNDVDLQLYALIAIILRESVQNWYTKITSDETFVAEIVQIIAHCTRALEQRLRKVDLESLLFDEIPDLVDKHVNTYRAAHDSVAQPPLQANPHEIYHSLCPLPALSPIPRPESPSTIDEQAQNEAAYRQLLVHGVLAILLPTEDLENDCLVALVGQLFSELIIGDIVANRLSEPWLIWEGLIILTRVIRERTNAAPKGPPTQSSSDAAPPSERRGLSVQRLFWSFMQWCFVATSFIRLLVTTLASSRSLPPRTRHMSSHSEDMTRQKAEGEAIKAANPLETYPGLIRVPVLAFRIFPAVSNLIEMGVRMPWLCGAMSLIHWIAMTGPGRIADVNGALDRILSHSLIHARILDPANLPPLLRGARAALFPNNMPGKPSLTAPSSAAELAALRRRCATALWGLVPKPLGRLYFGSDSGSGSGGGGGGASRSSWWALWSGGSGGDGGVVGHDDGQGQGQSQGHGSRPRRPRSGPADDDNDARRPASTSSSSSAASSTNSDGRREGGLAEKVGSAGASAGRASSAGGTWAAPAADRGGLAGSSDEGEEDGRILSEIEAGIVDVFGDKYCNKHLLYGILELVLVRLMPELAEKGIGELWEERLS